MSGFQPYVGPRPFEREDAEQRRFFGREAEASELLSRVIAHPALLFYSPSGAGKTSLLNAKLYPMLEKEGFTVLSPGRVRSMTPARPEVREPQNIYVFNALRSWDNNRTDPGLLMGMSLADYLRTGRATVEESDPVPRAVVFDQFEEIFTFHSERWEDRQDFFEQVGELLEEDRLMRVIFVMREDYIAELDPYLYLLPEKLRTRYRLERLNEESAMAAITGPLESTQYSFAEGVAEQLASNLLMGPVETAAGVIKVKGEFIEPVQLQVVCQALWESCQVSWRGLKPSERKVITREQLENFGNVDQALSDFYERAIKKVVQLSVVSEGKLRHWFEHSLITPVGTRGTVYRGSNESGGIPSLAINELLSQHLIVSEVRGGARWLELAHDRLIDPIKVSNENWRLRHSGGEQLRSLLESKAAQWMHSGRKNSDLLDEGELTEAKRWLDSEYAADIGFSDGLLALVQASRAVFEERQSRTASRLRRLAIALALMFLLAVGATIYALQQKARAEANATEARANATEARANAERASEAHKTSEEARQVAQQQADLASSRALQLEDANRLADEQRRRAEEQSHIAGVRAGEAIAAKQLAVATLHYHEASSHAFSFYKEGKLPQALEAYSHMAVYYELTGNRDDLLKMLNLIAEIYGKLGRPGEAAKAKARAEAVRRQIRGQR